VDRGARSARSSNERPVSHQSLTLGRHIRHALPPDGKKLYDAVWTEYRRITQDPRPNHIGMQMALLAECFSVWSQRPPSNGVAEAAEAARTVGGA